MSEDFIDKIANQLPIKQVYDDAISPAAKQVGAIGEDLLKTLRLALFPFQCAAAFQDRVESFIKKSVRKVPEDRRVAPPPQIIGPILEGIRFEPEDTPIDEMFSTLLSNSMDITNLHKSHPAFPILIRQLVRDEAIIVKELKTRTFSIIEVFDINPDAQHNSDLPYWINGRKEKLLEFPLHNLYLPMKFGFYTEHLFQLGLAAFSELRRPEIISDPSGRQTGTRNFLKFHLMPLGQSFVEACIPNGKSE